MCVGAFDSLTARLCLRSVSILRVKKEANTEEEDWKQAHIFSRAGLLIKQI
jgi:hypothetical protein